MSESVAANTIAEPLPSLEDLHCYKIRAKAKSWVRLRQRPLLIFHTEMVSTSTLEKVHAALAGQQYPKLDVLIESPGGFPDPAFQIVNVIRKHCQHLTTVVANWAKSAATLIGMSMDEIILGDLAQMGPLDTQIKTKYDKQSPKYASALEIVRAMKETQRSALVLWQLAAQLILQEEELTVHGSYQLASEFVGHVSGKGFSPLHLEQYGESVRSLEITKNYAKSLLVRHRNVKSSDADEIARQFVEDYASHGSIIDVEELEGMGLPARWATKEEGGILDDLRSLLRNHATPDSIIEVVSYQPDIEPKQSRDTGSSGPEKLIVPAPDNRLRETPSETDAGVLQ